MKHYSTNRRIDKYRIYITNTSNRNIHSTSLDTANWYIKSLSNLPLKATNNTLNVTHQEILF